MSPPTGYKEKMKDCFCDIPTKDAYTESNDEKTLDKHRLRYIPQSNACNLPKCQTYENQGKIQWMESCPRLKNTPESPLDSKEIKPANQGD